MKAEQSWVCIWRAAAILLVAATYLSLNMGWLHMHPDENLSYVSTDGDLGYVFRWQMTLQDNQAPGWFLTFWVWRQFMGDTEFASRMLSMSLSLLALAVAYRVGKRALHSEWAVSAGLLLLGGNALYFEYALDIRPYPMVMLVTMVSLWMFQRWLYKPTLRRALCYGASIAAMLYVHYLLALFVVVHGVYLLLAGGWRWRLLREFLAAGVFGTLLFLPWFPTFVAHVLHLRNLEATTGTARGVAGIGVSTFATTIETVWAYIIRATAGLPVVYAALLLAGAFLLRWNRRGWLLLVVCALGVPTLYLTVNLFAGVYAPRFVAYASIPLALALGGVVTRMPRVRGLAVGAVVLAGMLGAQIWLFGGQIPVRVPYREIFRAMASSEGAVVLVDASTRIDGYLRQQMAMYMPQPLFASVTTEPAEAIEARRIWFLTGDWFGEGVQERFRTLEHTHPLQRVLGRCDRAWCFLAQLMEAPPDAEATLFGRQLGFRGADVVRSDHRIDLRLWWQNPAPITLDYSFGIQVLDSADRLVAQSDGPLIDYGRSVVQTSQMETGRIYVDERRIDLPVDVNSELRLHLVVYQSWDGQRLTIDGERDTLLLGIIPAS
jgi:hypothetical protein